MRLSEELDAGRQRWRRLTVYLKFGTDANAAVDAHVRIPTAPAHLLSYAETPLTASFQTAATMMTEIRAARITTTACSFGDWLRRIITTRRIS
jgi:hypothetical protein